MTRRPLDRFVGTDAPQGESTEADLCVHLAIATQETQDRETRDSLVEHSRELTREVTSLCPMSLGSQQVKMKYPLELRALSGRPLLRRLPRCR